MSKEDADNGVVSSPMGRLYAGIPTVDMPNQTEINGTVTLRAHKSRAFHYDPEAKVSPSVTATIRKDNEQQQTQNVAVHRVCGEYDGHVTVSFKAGNGYSHSFSFALPNVIGNLGVAGINDTAITEMIERALVDKLGRGGVVRHKAES